MVRTRRELSESERIGFLIADPLRSAVAESLLRAGGRLAEGTLVEAALKVLKEGQWPADQGTVKHAVAVLHAADVVAPKAKGGTLFYTLTPEGETAIRKLFETG